MADPPQKIEKNSAFARRARRSFAIMGGGRKGQAPQERLEPMAKWLQKLVQFLKAEDGPTAVEYAVMLALIVVVCLVAITAMGTAANKTFGNIALQTATAGS